VSAAKFEAQQKENERIELEANATAEKLRREAQGKADARLAEAKAEADAIELVNKAVAESGPLLMQIRALEVEKVTRRAMEWPVPADHARSESGRALHLAARTPRRRPQSDASLKCILAPQDVRIAHPPGRKTGEAGGRRGAGASA